MRQVGLRNLLLKLHVKHLQKEPSFFGKLFELQVPACDDKLFFEVDHFLEVREDFQNLKEKYLDFQFPADVVKTNK